MEGMKNRALFDHKCPTCGSWMKSETKKSEKEWILLHIHALNAGFPTAPKVNGNNVVA